MHIKNEDIYFSRFKNYTLIIKDELLNQIVSNNSSSRKYFEIKYDELINKYIEHVDILNYNLICSKFVHDVYAFVPIKNVI